MIHNLVHQQGKESIRISYSTIYVGQIHIRRQSVKDGVGVPYPNPLKHWVELQSKESSGKVKLKLMMHKG